MNTPSPNAHFRKKAALFLISLAAGCGDFFAGLLLVLAPQRALAWMGAPGVHDWALLQFVGVFVACVGASYLWGLLAWMRSGSPHRLRGVWEWTILFRIAAGTFVAWEIAIGNFTQAWASVPLTDWSWALLQTALLRCGFFRETKA